MARLLDGNYSEWNRIALPIKVYLIRIYLYMKQQKTLLAMILDKVNIALNVCFLSILSDLALQTNSTSGYLVFFFQL